MSPDEVKPAKRSFGRLGVDTPYNDPLKMRAAAEAARRKAQDVEACNVG